MGNVTPISEQFPHFVKNLQENFWGDLNGKAQSAMKGLLESDSQRQRDRWVGLDRYERGERREGEYRNGY